MSILSLTGQLLLLGTFSSGSKLRITASLLVRRLPLLINTISWKMSVCVCVSVTDVTHSDVVSFQRFLDRPRDPRGFSNVLDCDPRTVTSTVLNFLLTQISSTKR